MLDDRGRSDQGGHDRRVNDHRLAARIANDAGRLLITLRRDRADATDLGAQGDRISNELILRELAAARPADAVLSEESADDPARLVSARVWVVDPLDGTREYGERGRSDWAVHVALVVDGAVAASAVALPAQRLVLCTAPAPVLPPRERPRPRLVVSRTRPPEITDAVAAALDAELLPMGSAGAKVAAIVAGEADAYVHAGGQYEWDSAAPVGVALAAGLHASRLDGSPLRYNRPDPKLPDLVVCRRELADAVLHAVRAGP